MTPDIIAAYIHAGQVDKAGRPILLHCGRVADALPEGTPLDVVAAAWLHESIEDGRIARDLPCTLEWLACYVSPWTLALVDEVTRKPGVRYSDYIAGLSYWAAVVKLADVRDNLREPVPGDLKRRYLRAERMLLENVGRGP